MKKSSAIFVTILLLVVLSGCGFPISKVSFRHYQNSPIHIDPEKKDLELIASNVHRIQTSLRFRMGDFTPTIGAIGLATSLDQHYLLAPHHVVKIKSA